MDSPLFLDIALHAVKRYGFSIIPRARDKKPILGANLGSLSRTNTEEGVRAFAARVPEDANYSICSDENFTILESDDETRFRRLVSETSKKLYGETRELPATLTSYGRPNRPHWFYKRTCEMTPAPKVGGLFEWRHNNQYVAGFGSIHPATGEPYRLVDPEAPIAPFPEWLSAVLLDIRSHVPSDYGKSGKASGPERQPDRNGLTMLKEAYIRGGKDPAKMKGLDLSIANGRHDTIKSMACFLHDGKRTKEELTEILIDLWDEYCVGSGDGDDRGTGKPRPGEIEDLAKYALTLKPCGLDAGPFFDGMVYYPTIEERDKARADRLLKEYNAEEKEKAAKPSLAFRPQSLAIFMKHSYPAPEPLVENVLFLGDFTSLTGRRRNGKTTLLHNLALAGALGETSYLGLNIVRPFKTLAFYFEDDPGDMQEKLGIMLNGRSAPEAFHLYTKQDFRNWELVMDVTDPAFRSRILECCDAHKPDWITFDNLGILIGADYNNAKAIHALVQFVWEIQGKYRCAVTVAAHPRKQSSDLIETLSLVKNPNRFFEECMGSSHFINSTGAMWGVERDEGDRTYLVLGSQRVTGDYTVTVAEKDDTHWLRQVKDDQMAKSSLLNTDKRKAAWASFPESFSFAVALEAQTSLSKASFTRWWSELKRAKLILCLPDGRFQRTEKMAAETEYEEAVGSVF